MTHLVRGLPLVLSSASLLGLAFSAPAAAQSNVFSNPLTAVGASPVAVAAGDLDGDGLLDVVTANSGSNDVTAVHGLGGGAFGATASFPVGASPSGVTLADLDGDGALDVATANYTASSVSVRLGNGLGGFGTLATYSVALQPRDLDFGDLNGDGALDLVAFTSNVTRVSVRLGDGLGGFGGLREYDAGGLPNDGKLADANGDGALDAITSNYSSQSLSTIPGAGDGTFLSPIVTSTAPFFPNSLALADMNSDGKIDAVSPSPAGPPGLTVFLGDGAGAYAPAGNVALALSTTAVVADVDGDSNLDVITSAAVSFGSSTMPQIVYGDGAGGIALGPTIPSPGSASAMAALDFNGDGATDVAIASTGGFLLARLNDGSGGFPAPPSFSLPNAPGALFVEDLNRDGKLDVLASGASSFPGAVRLGDGAGGFGPPSSIGAGGAFAVADVNGDSIPDVLQLSNAGNSASVRLGDGAGGFGAPTSFPVAGPVSGDVGDVDGDGDLDLMLAATSVVGPQATPYFALLLGDGLGSFGPPIASLSPFPDFSFQVRLVELNDDGKLDRVIVGGPNAQLQLGDGAGAFATSAAFGVSPLFFLSLSCATATRVDDDPFVDLVFMHAVFFSSGPGTFVQRGNGAGGLLGSFSLGIPVTQGFGLRDVTGDGKADLVYELSPAGVLSVRAGDGAGAFGPPANFDAGVLPGGLQLADLDGDGRLDAISADAFTNSFVVLLNLVPDPPGISAYGLGTPGCKGVHGIATTGTPAVANAEFAVTNTGAPPSSLGLLIVGNAQDAAGTDVFGIGAIEHVDLFASTLLLGFNFFSNEFGDGITPIPIPANPSLAGATVYAQGAWFWEACAPSPFHLSKSRGLAITIQ